MNRRSQNLVHRLWSAFDDFAHAIIAAFLFLTASSVLYASDGSELGIVESALKQGGLLAAMILILIFYRRDWAKLNVYQQQTNDQLMKLVQENITVMTQMRDEIRGLRRESNNK
jgi:hypothetical protein